MAVLVYSVVRRHMKKTSPGAFTVADATMETPAKLALGPGESVIGWYRNPPPWEQQVIVFTSEAFYLVDDGQVERLPITDLTGYESPKSKTDVTGIRVLTKNGFHFVRIAGCHGPNGNYKDAFSFIMVVRALVPGTPVIKFQANTSDSHKRG